MEDAVRGKPEMYGIPNFGYIAPKIYRGAQPKWKDSFKYLADLGVKRVICLRFEDDTPAGEAVLVIQNGIDFFNVGFSPLLSSAPISEKVEKVLKIVDELPGKVFIHCQFGCERTGLISACWRIRKDGWTNEAALKEADGYGMSEYFEKLRQFILNFK